MDHLAHVKQRNDGTWDQHPLEEHLRSVSNLAGDSAAVFASAPWGRLAGLWHDLGKYQPEFQKYIRSASGLDAHIESETAPGKVKHAIVGAIHAIGSMGPYGRLLAYLIAGHHAGLPDCGIRGGRRVELPPRNCRTIGKPRAKPSSVKESRSKHHR